MTTTTLPAVMYDGSSKLHRPVKLSDLFFSVDVQSFRNPGTYLYTPPAWADVLIVEVTGAGGGSGANWVTYLNGYNISSYAGGGGGAGGYAKGVYNREHIDFVGMPVEVGTGGVCGWFTEDKLPLAGTAGTQSSFNKSTLYPGRGDEYRTLVCGGGYFGQPATATAPGAGGIGGNYADNRATGYNLNLIAGARGGTGGWGTGPQKSSDVLAGCPSGPIGGASFYGSGTPPQINEDIVLPPTISYVPGAGSGGGSLAVAGNLPDQPSSNGIVVITAYGFKKKGGPDAVQQAYDAQRKAHDAYDAVTDAPLLVINPILVETAQTYTYIPSDTAFCFFAEVQASGGGSASSSYMAGMAQGTCGGGGGGAGAYHQVWSEVFLGGTKQNFNFTLGNFGQAGAAGSSGTGASDSALQYINRFSDQVESILVPGGGPSVIVLNKFIGATPGAGGVVGSPYQGGGGGQPGNQVDDAAYFTSANIGYGGQSFYGGPDGPTINGLDGSITFDEAGAPGSGGSGAPCWQYIGGVPSPGSVKGSNGKLGRIVILEFAYNPAVPAPLIYDVGAKKHRPVDLRTENILQITHDTSIGSGPGTLLPPARSVLAIADCYGAGGPGVGMSATGATGAGGGAGAYAKMYIDMRDNPPLGYQTGVPGKYDEQGAPLQGLPTVVFDTVINSGGPPKIHPNWTWSGLKSARYCSGGDGGSVFGTAPGVYVDGQKGCPSFVGSMNSGYQYKGTGYGAGSYGGGSGRALTPRVINTPPTLTAEEGAFGSGGSGYMYSDEPAGVPGMGERVPSKYGRPGRIFITWFRWKTTT